MQHEEPATKSQVTLTLPTSIEDRLLNDWADPQLGFKREWALRVHLSRHREQSWVVGKGQEAPGVMYN